LDNPICVVSHWELKVSVALHFGLSTSSSAIEIKRIDSIYNPISSPIYLLTFSWILSFTKKQRLKINFPFFRKERSMGHTNLPRDEVIYSGGFTKLSDIFRIPEELFRTLRRRLYAERELGPVADRDQFEPCARS